MQYYWLNRSNNKSYASFGFTFYEQINTLAFGEVIPVRDFYATLHTTLGYDYRLSPKSFLRLGAA